MIFVSKRKIEESIKEKRISMKEFVIYSFICFGSLFSFFRTSKYSVVSNEYTIAQLISFASIVVWVVGFVACYKIVKGKEVDKFAYTIVPLISVFRIRYGIFLTLPLVIINVFIIKRLELNFPFWNAINSQIIGLVVSIIIVSNLLKSIKKLFNYVEK